MKRFVALLLTFIMIFSNVQITLAEDTVNDGSLEVSDQYINPLYEAVITEDDLPDSTQYTTAVLAEPVFTADESEIVEQIRSAMVARAETFTLYYKSETILNQGFLKKWVDMATEETGEPDEGDYLKLHYGGMSIPAGNGTGVYDDEGNIDYTLIVVASYYTTADQEAEVDEAVDALINMLDISNEMSNYEKIKTIYDYMCANIDYDYDNLNDHTYKLKYTAYAALINKTAVCQGYTSLLYRLLREVGVDVRAVTGTGNGGGHAWNLVNIGEQYYYADATWDAVRNPYEFFLKGTTDFGDHQVDEVECAFIKDYQIPETGYVNHEHVWDKGTDTVEPTCKETGIKTYTCGSCGDTKTEDLPKTAHIWETEYTVDQKSTCKTEGSKSFHCSVCDAIDEESIESIPVTTEHNWDKGKVTTKPTCTKEGKKLYTCKVCGTTDVASVAALGHDWEDEYTVDVAPTYDTAGSKSIHCDRCDLIKTGSKVSIPKLEKSDSPFIDVSSSSRFYKEIMWAYENGITAGKTATTFAPEADCTRGQVVTFLWRAEGCPEPTISANPFTDVASTSPFYKAILWAYENGITTGKTATTFEPDTVVTREQFVTFLWRCENKPASSVSNPFVDVVAGRYSTPAILWAYENGITTGKTATTFQPSATVIRQHVVTFLYRAYN